MSPVKKAAPPVSSHNRSRSFVAFVFDRAGFNSRHRAQQSRFGRDGKDCGFSSLRDIDRVIDVGAAVGIVTVSDDTTSTRRPWAERIFSIAELPDRIVQRGLLSGFFHREDRLVEQLKPIGKILSQSNFMIESREQHPIPAWPHDRLNKVHRRFLLELQFRCGRRRRVHQHGNVKRQVVVLFTGERIDLPAESCLPSSENHFGSGRATNWPFLSCTVIGSRTRRTLTTSGRSWLRRRRGRRSILRRLGILG